MRMLRCRRAQDDPDPRRRRRGLRRPRPPSGRGRHQRAELLRGEAARLAARPSVETWLERTRRRTSADQPPGGPRGPGRAARPLARCWSLTLLSLRGLSGRRARRRSGSSRGGCRSRRAAHRRRRGPRVVRRDHLLGRLDRTARRRSRICRLARRALRPSAAAGPRLGAARLRAELGRHVRRPGGGLRRRAAHHGPAARGAPGPTCSIEIAG